MASALSYLGTCQKYHCFHRGKPLTMREVFIETENPGVAVKVSPRCGVFVCNSAPSYGAATLLVSHL